MVAFPVLVVVEWFTGEHLKRTQTWAVVVTFEGKKKERKEGRSRYWMMVRIKRRHSHHYCILATDVCLFCAKYKRSGDAGDGDWQNGNY